MPPETTTLVFVLRFIATACSWVQAWQLGGAIGSALFLVAANDAPLRRGETASNDQPRDEVIRDEVFDHAKKFFYAWTIALACTVTALQMTDGLAAPGDASQAWG